MMPSDTLASSDPAVPSGALIKKAVLMLLLLGNIIGAIFGFTWWYGEQLLNTPWYLWLFAAPSPMYASFFVIAAFMILAKRPDHHSFFFPAASFFFYLSSVGLVKYGIWTVVFWLTYPGSAALGTLMILWLAFSHGTMALESSLLYHEIRLKRHGIPCVLITLAWFLLNDYFDYAGPTMMTKVAIPHMDIASSTALALTVLAPFIVYIIAKKVRKPVLGLLK